MPILIGTEQPVNTVTTEEQQEPQITALAKGGWVVTWTPDAQDGDLTGIYQQRYSSTGVPVGSEARVNDAIAGEQHYLTSPRLIRAAGWSSGSATKAKPAKPRPPPAL